jgi:hypothetical protein
VCAASISSPHGAERIVPPAEVAHTLEGSAERWQRFGGKTQAARRKPEVVLDSDS